MSTLRVDHPIASPEAPALRPTLEEVRALAARGGQVPIVSEMIADCDTPVSVFLKLREAGPAFLLESAEEGQRLGRYSMVGVRPQAVIEGRGGRLVLRSEEGERELDASDPFGAVEDVVAAVGMNPPVGDVPLWGGGVGFFGYDLVRQVEHLPDGPPDDRDLSDLFVMITGPLAVFDHLRRTVTLIAPCRLEPGEDPEPGYRRAARTISELRRRLAGPVPTAPVRVDEAEVGPVETNMTRDAFEATVERIREYIFAGDAFQVVPSQRFTARMTLDPFAVYRGLRAVNPSPYMFFVDTGTMQLVGSSPEMLVKVEGRRVELHPIAGTRPRGETAADDAKLAEELIADPKERAEHVMLVDLGRNDVGRVSEPGSVAVTDIMTVRNYSHVMHIESSVVGELSPGRRASDALRAAFPAGTLSGAPKVRAMEIIDEVEPTKRGPYGGAVGHLGWNGDLDTCITIRTIVCKDGFAHVQAGAGIVADSVPATEFVETQNKAAALFRAIELAAAQPDW